MDNKEKLRQSVGRLKKMKKSQREIAEAISLKTRKPCSERSFRTWLAAPEKAETSITCPDWVIEVVEEYENEVRENYQEAN